MKHLALVLALVATPALAVADAPDHVFNGADETSTVDCGEGGTVVINGSTNTVTTTGGCAKVVINGADNTVQIDAADKIVVTGSGNTVTWHKGWKKKTPKVARLGAGNTIKRVK